MTPPGGDWTLVSFLEGLDLWIAEEQPDDDLRLVVTTWVLSRAEDPYRGDCRRDPVVPNLWAVAIPKTRHDGDLVVVATYFIEERSHSVRCNQIGSLTLPLA